MCLNVGHNQLIREIEKTYHRQVGSFAAVGKLLREREVLPPTLQQFQFRKMMACTDEKQKIEMPIPKVRRATINFKMNTFKRI